MTMFIIGLISGMAAFALIASVVIFNKLQLEVAAMHRMLQVIALKINKIEKTTDATMNAAETFVDGLRESAEHIQRQMMPPPKMGKMNPEMFDDLRKSFEEGIRKFEENELEEGDDDVDEENNEEPWKK